MNGLYRGLDTARARASMHAAEQAYAEQAYLAPTVPEASATVGSGWRQNKKPRLPMLTCPKGPSQHCASGLRRRLWSQKTHFVRFPTGRLSGPAGDRSPLRTRRKAVPGRSWPGGPSAHLGRKAQSIANMFCAGCRGLSCTNAGLWKHRRPAPGDGNGPPVPERRCRSGGYAQRHMGRDATAWWTAADRTSRPRLSSQVPIGLPRPSPRPPMRASMRRESSRRANAEGECLSVSWASRARPRMA